MIIFVTFYRHKRHNDSCQEEQSKTENKHVQYIIILSHMSN